ncbi:MAG: insulinase family protein [Bdellovibrionales bacterium]|nr:insulinase family protein [Bdellovibrionales bacterium]
MSDTTSIIKKTPRVLKGLTKTLPLILVAFLFDACSSMGVTSKPIKPAAGFNVKKKVLKNGLTVLVSPNPKLPIVSYYTLFDVGGRDEGVGTTGATHFLEHMMFKGAKKYGPGEFDTKLERSGGATNAYTTNDMTVYYQNIPVSFLETMIDMEADRMQNLLLEPVSFESERQVIFEERKMRYENSPDGLIFLNLMKKVFAGTPYGQSVIGEEADLKALTRDQMLKFFKDYYVPNNAIVAIVGDVDPDQVIAMVEEKYGNIPASTELKSLKDQTAGEAKFKSQAEFGKEYKYYATNPIPKFVLAFQGDKLGTRKSYVMDILAMILGNGGSSYLNQRYVKSDNPMLSEINLANFNLIHSGVFYFSGDLMEGKKIEDVKSRIMGDFKVMCDEAITVRSLQKSKNQILAQGYGQLKTNAGSASTIIRNEKWHKDYNYGLKEMEIYNSISENEVQIACREVLIESQSIFISTWDKYPKTAEIK